MEAENQTTKARPSDKAIKKAKNRLDATIAAEKMAGVLQSDSTEAVTDPVTTPFLMAMNDEGYKARQGKADTLIIDRCYSCRQSSRFTFTGSTGEFKLCALCLN